MADAPERKGECDYCGGPMTRTETEMWCEAGPEVCGSRGFRYPRIAPHNQPPRIRLTQHLDQLADDIPLGPDDVEYLRSDLVRPDWRPIETAPRDGTEVQLWRGKFKQASQVVGYWDTEGKSPCWRESYEDVLIRPTHWQPLPSPPEAEDG